MYVVALYLVTVSRDEMGQTDYETVENGRVFGGLDLDCADDE
jgi:hypothetical protein